MEIGLIQKSFDVEWWFESYIFHNVPQLVEFPKSWYLPVIGSTGYLCFIYFGQRYMKTRKRFELRTPMFLWSTCLAIFSLVGVWRGSSKIFENFYFYGFRSTVCIHPKYSAVPVMRFWGLVMTYSKYAEYVDTVFIVLQRKNLPFLHWYHHLTVSLYAWYVYDTNIPGGYVFCAMNFAVHAVMYIYYALKAARIYTPKYFALFITIMQTAQMFAGCTIVAGMIYWRNNGNCNSTLTQQTISLILYTSYLLLFINFFYYAYIGKGKTNKLLSDKSKIIAEDNKTKKKI